MSKEKIWDSKSIQVILNQIPSIRGLNKREE